MAREQIDDIIFKIKSALETQLPELLLKQKKELVAERGGNHDWLPLSDYTKRRKGNDQPWIESGDTMEAMEIGYTDNGDSLSFYVDQEALPEYAEQVNYGTDEGTGRFNAKIPARPLFNFTAIDREQVKGWVRQIVKETLSGYNAE